MAEIALTRANLLIRIEKMAIKQKYISFFLWLTLTAFSAITVAFASLYLYLSPKLPSVETLHDVKFQTPLRVYSADMQLIGQFGEKLRDPITFKDIPQAYVHALLAAEDDQFFHHNGVSIKGILRGVSQIVKTGRKGSGGSTITMQVARNFFLTLERTYLRKAKEILLTFQIEKELSKEQILELYVNKIFMGNRAHGLKAAAQIYYGKSIQDLSLAQQAMLAGLYKAPSKYNPIANPERATIRRNWILGRMLELGYIDTPQHQLAIAEPVSAKYHGLTLDYDMPYVAELARKEALEMFGEAAYTDGYSIVTSIDSKLQDSAQQALVNGLLSYDERHGYRGPEGQIALPAREDDTPFTEQELQSLSKKLAEYPRYGNLEPALVIGQSDQSLTLLLDTTNKIELEWEQGLNSARPYLNASRRGPRPQLSRDVANPGDVIRLRQQEDGTWHLSQVPDAQAALVSLNPENGAILSLVGGFDFHHSHFNRATQAERQPGSNFKPFIYATALENGYTPATIVNDAPIVFDDASLEDTWRPENDGGKFYGPTRLRKALYKSRNLVSIRVLRSIGIRKAIDGLDRYGFNNDKLPRDLSLALGSHDLTPLEIATGYAVFANGGYRVEPFLIHRAMDINDDIVFEHRPLTVCRECENEADSSAAEATGLRLQERQEQALLAQIDAEAGQINNTANQPAADSQTAPSDSKSDSQNASIEAVSTTNLAAEDSLTAADEPLPRAPKVLSDQVAYLINSMLQDVIQKGTGRRARVLGRDDLAGKTGTTNGPKDAWFSGYSPHVVTTTWLGFDQHTPLGNREYGGSAALPIWIDYMRAALDGKPSGNRPQPDGLVTLKINPDTGERTSVDDPNAIFETFRVENAPELIANSDNSITDPHSPEVLPEELF